MAISLNEKISFTANVREKDKKDAEKKVVTGGGAVAATTAFAKTKASKSAFDVFSSSKKVSQGMQTFTQTTRAAANVTKQSRGLWAKVVNSSKSLTKSILNWRDSLGNVKFFKPILKSKAFNFAAGALGYGFGLVTMISGLSDIVNVTVKSVEEKI